MKRFVSLAVLFVLHCGEAKAGFVLLVANEIGGTINQINESGQVSIFASRPLDKYTGLALDASGNVYAASNGNNLVARFSPTGVDLGPFITSGLSWPTGLAFDSAGNLYVANATGHKDVLKFSSTGAPLGTFISGTSVDHIAISPSGDFYTTESMPTSTNDVLRYSLDGTLLNPVALDLNGPAYMAFDADGNIYISGYFSNTVEVYTPTGTHLATYSSPGLSGPTGLAFDPDGNLYVAFRPNGVIRKFSATGQDLGNFAEGLTSPNGLAIQASAVPEPTTFALLGFATVGGLGMRFRQRRRAKQPLADV